jgi:hypothetical protein
MDQAISAKIKKILKAKANKAKVSYKSPKQVSKQSQVVIINSEKPKRRYTKRGKASTGGGGGDGGQKVVYIPQYIPNMSIPMSSPQEIRQPIPQMIREFQPTATYRNPLRMEPFRSALNPPIFTENKPNPRNMDQYLPENSLPTPPPVMPDIVLEQNHLDMPTSPAPTLEIHPSSFSGQGFTENKAVNQLNRRIQKEIKAYEDFGGYDANSPREPDVFGQISPIAETSVGEEIGGYYRQRKRGQIQIESEGESSVGGGGGQKPSNKGRPFTALTEQDKEAIQLYIYAKNDKELKKGLTESDKAIYKRGRLIISQNKSRNPEVVAAKQEAYNMMAKGGKK